MEVNTAETNGAPKMGLDTSSFVTRNVRADAMEIIEPTRSSSPGQTALRAGRCAGGMIR
jgi:hypothetical protein